jgi:hypothetical protein
MASSSSGRLGPAVSGSDRWRYCGASSATHCCLSQRGFRRGGQYSRSVWEQRARLAAWSTPGAAAARTATGQRHPHTPPATAHGSSPAQRRAPATSWSYAVSDPSRPIPRIASSATPTTNAVRARGHRHLAGNTSPRLERPTRDRLTVSVNTRHRHRRSTPNVRDDDMISSKLAANHGHCCADGRNPLRKCVAPSSADVGDLGAPLTQRSAASLRQAGSCARGS